MRRRKMASLALLGLTVVGCGPPEIVPLTPPGVAYRKVAGEGMDAEGENRNRGTISPKTGPGGAQPTRSTEEVQPQQPSGDAPAK